MDLTFYDRNGEPLCYTYSDIIYSFKGDVLAYVYDDHIYKINGEHLGWLYDGWIIDHRGQRVYFSDNAKGGPCKPVKKVCHVKSCRHVVPCKSVRKVAPVRPCVSLSWSNTRGLDFFN